MIGQIEFDLHRHRKSAVLTDELSWQSDDKQVESLLNRLSPKSDRPTPPRPGLPLSPAAHARHILYRVGQRFGGRIVLGR